MQQIWCYAPAPRMLNTMVAMEAKPGIILARLMVEKFDEQWVSHDLRFPATFMQLAMSAALWGPTWYEIGRTTISGVVEATRIGQIAGTNVHLEWKLKHTKFSDTKYGIEDSLLPYAMLEDGSRQIIRI